MTANTTINNQTLKHTHTHTQKKTPKQTTRTGTESQKWRSHGRLSVGEWVRKEGETVQRISSINGRWKIDRGRVRIV